MRPSGAATWITEEPDEGNLHVRICGGIGWQQLILPGTRGGHRVWDDGWVCGAARVIRVVRRDGRMLDGIARIDGLW
jgi:hypothetical protein